MNSLKLIACTSLVALFLSAADLPRPAPNTVFPAPNGGSIDISKFKGKVIAIEFLLTTCPHCQKTAGIMQRMQDEYGANGFQAFGVATDTATASVVEDFRRRFGVKFPVGWGQREVVHGYLQHPVMRTMYMPQLVFVDRKGAIRAQYPGGDGFFDDMRQVQNFRSQIEMLLKETAPAAPRAVQRSSASAKK
jgi:thiol-disulfide isomerase/thioredoxin